MIYYWQQLLEIYMGYIRNMAENLGITAKHQVTTPMIPNKHGKETPAEIEYVRKFPLEVLNYVAMVSRPDIQYAVYQLKE